MGNMTSTRGKDGEIIDFFKWLKHIETHFWIGWREELQKTTVRGIKTYGFSVDVPLIKPIQSHELEL